MAADPPPSLVETCRFLCDPQLNGRAPGSLGHEVAREYLRRLLECSRFSPLFGDSWSQEIAREGHGPIGFNVGGIKRGLSERWILLAAHYDHFEGIPGADDNAAALSILVETARLIGPWNGENSLVLCFFDLEEPPYFHTPLMGSMFFVEHAPLSLEHLTCAIVLDLCGHDVPIPGREDALFVLGAERSAGLVGAVESVNTRPPFAYMFQNVRVGDMSDHHAFRVRNLPFLFFSCGWWEHYHRPTDTFERLNLHKMRRIAEYLAALVGKLDGAEIKIDPVRDFWQREAQSLAHLLGIPAPPTQRAVDHAVAAALRHLAF
jgi:hypothetical protein